MTLSSLLRLLLTTPVALCALIPGCTEASRVLPFLPGGRLLSSAHVSGDGLRLTGHMPASLWNNLLLTRCLLPPGYQEQLVFQVTHWKLPPKTAMTNGPFIAHLVRRALKRTTFRLAWPRLSLSWQPHHTHLYLPSTRPASVTKCRNRQMLINTRMFPSVFPQWQLQIYLHVLVSNPLA